MMRTIYEPSRGRFVRFSIYGVLVCFLFLFVNFSIEGDDLVNVPLGHEVYSFIDRMVARGVLPAATQASLPISRGQVTDLLIEISRKLEAGKLSLSRIEQVHLKAYFKIFAQELRKRGINITPKQERKYFFTLQDKGYMLNIQPIVQQRTVIQQSDKSDVTEIIFIHPTIFGEIEEKFVYNTDYKWGPLISGERYVPLPDETRRSSGDFNQISTLESYTKIGWRGLSLELGKDDLWWGPGRHGALMLSDNSDSKDLLKFEGRMSLFKLSSFTAILRRKLSKTYMSGHRLEMNFHDSFYFALHETIVYSDRFELNYLNPFTIYTLSLPMVEYGEYEEEKREGIFPSDNLLIGGDIKYRIIPNFEIYSEFMLDDYQPQFGLRGFRAWNSKFGILLGTYYVDPFALENTDLRIEYAFVNQYAYTHKSLVNAYTNRKRVIGHHIGPDADDLWIEFKHWFTDKIQAALAYELLRHGEGNVNKPHQPDGPEKWEFLSGITESTHSLSLNLSYLSIGNYSSSLEYKYSLIKNSKHQLSVDDSKQQLVVEVEYRF